MTDLIFLDTETTGLGMDADIWEFAAIRRRAADGTYEQLHLFIDHDYRKCVTLPKLFLADHLNRWNAATSVTQDEARQAIGLFLAREPGQPRPHIVGAVPDFDAYRIAAQFIAPDLPEWHHHLIDVENLAVGYLAAKGTPMLPPWDSNDLSRAVGVDPDLFERHTAMGDVLWAQAIYDRVMGGGQ